MRVYRHSQAFVFLAVRTEYVTHSLGWQYDLNGCLRSRTFQAKPNAGSAVALAGCDMCDDGFNPIRRYLLWISIPGTGLKMSNRSDGDGDMMENAADEVDATDPVVIESFDHEIEKKRAATATKNPEKNRKKARVVDDDVEAPQPDGSSAQHPATRKRSPKAEFEYPVEPRTILLVDRPRAVVNHSYRDFSQVPRTLEDNGTPKDIADMTFSLKLHDILSIAHYSPFITWMPHGRAFRVNVPKRFEHTIAPLYFGHSRYSTFLCQLNDHGFKYITQGTDRNTFYHEVRMFSDNNCLVSFSQKS